MVVNIHTNMHIHCSVFMLNDVTMYSL